MSEPPGKLDPAVLRRIQIWVAAVLVTMAVLAAIPTFTGVWPAAPIAAFIGSGSRRLIFVSMFVAEGLVALAILVPLAIVVNVIRRARDR